MSLPLALGSLNVIAAVITIPWRGAWYADLTIDLQDQAVAPTGAQVLTVGAAPDPVMTFAGTIDPRWSGSFVGTARVRLVAGAGGWSKPVTAQDFSSLSNVPVNELYRATAALVGETVSVSGPGTGAAHFVRTASGPGPAVRVFGDLDWYVDFAGITQVGSRPAATADTDLQLLNFEALEQRATLAGAFCVPNTTLSDPRLNGASPIVRDVEMRIDHTGTWVTAWCSGAPISRAEAALRALVREYAGVATLKTYEYRYVLSSSGGLALQATDASAGAPDLNPIAEGTGMAGVLATLAPSTLVYITFVAGRPTQPLLISYDSSKVPLQNSLDATTLVKVGPSAASVLLAGGADFLVKATPYADLLAALAVFASALSTASNLGNVIAAGDALNTALGGLPPAPTTITKAS
jgi:hypothetical protein